MNDILLIIAVILGGLNLILLLFLLISKKSNSSSKTDEKLDRIGSMVEYSNQIANSFNNILLSQQKERLNDLTVSVNNLNSVTEQRLNNFQNQLNNQLKFISEQNAKSLEQIRLTVDEKLSNTLENRLSKSYSIINERLEAVYKGIGEVQNLATSVSDIKKVFTNVKLRGTWGEVRLSALLEQMLAKNQYASSVKLNDYADTMVDFAIILPSKDDKNVYLPIDSKFPIEAYQRLITATDEGDKEKIDVSVKNLAKAVKLQADSIAEKYILPPSTTDFAVMFIPLESLYGEILKTDGLSEYLNSKRIMICSPTTFSAFLSTVQMGFKTTAIEKRSTELYELLSAFKKEFENFTLILDKTQKKLQEAQDTIEGASRKTRTIQRKLKNVVDIDGDKAEKLLSDNANENT